MIPPTDASQSNISLSTIQYVQVQRSQVPRYILDCSHLCPSCKSVDPSDENTCRVRCRMQCDSCKYFFCTRGALHTSQKCCGWLVCVPVCTLFDVLYMLLIVAAILGFLFLLVNGDR